MGDTRLDYVDQEGIKRRVRVPDAYTDPVEGIPVSVPVDNLYLHMPLAFRVALVNELWAVGLIEPADFAAGNAPERVRAALLAVVKHDTFDILNLAREMNHGR